MNLNRKMPNKSFHVLKIVIDCLKCKNAVREEEREKTVKWSHFFEFYHYVNDSCLPKRLSYSRRKSIFFFHLFQNYYITTHWSKTTFHDTNQESKLREGKKSLSIKVYNVLDIFMDFESIFSMNHTISIDIFMGKSEAFVSIAWIFFIPTQYTNIKMSICFFFQSICFDLDFI